MSSRRLPRTNSAILRSIRSVIGLEADTLKLARAAVGKPFAKAVRRFAACRGKVIVTGTEKSEKVNCYKAFAANGRLSGAT